MSEFKPGDFVRITAKEAECEKDKELMENRWVDSELVIGDGFGVFLGEIRSDELDRSFFIVERGVSRGPEYVFPEWVSSTDQRVRILVELIDKVTNDLESSLMGDDFIHYVESAVSKLDSMED